MTDITSKPFDWNDNLSKEALEDFEGIQKDLPYCTCQNIGMALAKLELLEKQGCKCEKPNDIPHETVTEFADRCRECGKMKRCRDCKYFEYDSVAKVDGIPLIVAHEICSKWGDGCKTSENGYCFLFEPKEGHEE